MKNRSIAIDLAAQSLVVGLGLSKFKSLKTIEQVCDQIDHLPKNSHMIAFLMLSIVHRYDTTELLDEINGRINSEKLIPYSLHDRPLFLNFLKKELQTMYSPMHSSLSIYEPLVQLISFNQSSKNLTVFDPTLGNGILFFQNFLSEKESSFQEYENYIELTTISTAKKLLGFDINSQQIQVATWLAKTLGFDFEIAEADSLLVIANQKADVVICDPPFGLKLAPAQIDREWLIQRPSQFASAWAWVQICLERIESGGAGIVFLPLAALGTSKKEEILARNKIFRKGLIDAVITLPSQPSNWHQIPTCALILRSPLTKQEANQSKTLFIDIPKIRKDKTVSNLSVITGDKIIEAKNTYQKFRNNNNADREGYSRSVYCSDMRIVDTDADLTPSLYVTNLIGGLDLDLSYRKEAEKLGELTDSLRDRIKAVTTQLGKNRELRATYARFGQLVGEKKVILIPGANTRKSSPANSSASKSSGVGQTASDSVIQTQIHVLDASDIRRPGPLKPIETRSVAMSPSHLSRVTTQPGDVVLARTGEPAAKVDYKGGHVILSPLSIIRITRAGREQLTPEIMASVLTSDLAKKFMRGVTIGRLSIEKIPIPVFNPESLHEIQDLLLPIKQLSEASNELNEQVLQVMKKLETTLSAGIDSPGGST